MKRNPPHFLYYTTITLPDDTKRTPNIFVYDNKEQGIEAVKTFQEVSKVNYKSIEIKEIKFIDEVELHRNFNDVYGKKQSVLDEEYADWHQRMVENAEKKAPKSLVSVLTKEIDDGKINFFYMVAYLPTDNISTALEILEHAPFSSPKPIEKIWFYQPTGDNELITAKPVA